MGVKGVVPSTLVRALQRFAVREDDATDASDHVVRGLLLGSSSSSSTDENTVTVWGVLRNGDQRDVVLPHLPGGVAPVGSFVVWVTGEAVKDEAEEADEAAALAKTHADTTVAPLVMVYVHESKRLYLFDSSWSVQPLEIVDCLHASDFIAATDSLVLRSAVTLEAESLAQLTKLREEVENDGSTSLFFQFPEDHKAIFNAHGVNVTSQEAAGSVEVLSSLVKIPEKRVAEPAATSNKSKKNKAKASYDAWDSSKQPSGETAKSTDFLNSCADANASAQYLKTLEYGEIAHVELLQSVAFTTLPNMRGTPPSVEIPSSNSTKTASKTRTRVHVDALVVVAQSASVAETIKALREELIKQISRLEALWTETAESLQAHHFGLTGAAFPLTMPSANGRLSISKATTTAIADALLQPPARPLFDPSRCSFVSKAAVLADIDVLFNVHEGIPASGVPNGTQYLVDGFYGYYHYMQQAMNDKGWGCAYRSLQTLASWLFWNQYTTPSTRSPTLTHREIQQTLVKIGDKPAAFVGSRDWIGSMEVGFVLDEVFGISFRTLNVSSGPDLVSKAQELKHHFETQGTPVMMGGGQLAFTLLGIDYNASSGDCAFLILDPHYVGAEDLATIQTKTIPLEGYKAVPCGWRKASTFAKNSFYNLCLPQRPVE